MDNKPINKFAYTKRVIGDIVYEILRRQKVDLDNGVFKTIDDFLTSLEDKFQGAYGVVRVTSTDWGEAAEWFNEYKGEITAWIETELGINLIS